MSRIRIAVTVLAIGITTAALAHAAQAPATAKATTAPTSSSAPAAKSTSTHKSSSKAMHIDINSATREQLMSLPGVGDATADKIIAARPFKSKEELKSKNILTKAEYDKLASHITAKAEKAEPAAKK